MKYIEVVKHTIDAYKRHIIDMDAMLWLIGKVIDEAAADDNISDEDWHTLIILERKLKGGEV